MEEKLVDININLSVSVSENKMIAHLSFSNIKAERIFLDRLTICYDDEIKNNLFKILDKNNNRVDYKGVMLKRVITSDDFVAIEPGEKISIKISLDEVYKLVPGKGYSVQYYAYNPSYEDISGLTKLESNIVEVEY